MDDAAFDIFAELRFTPCRCQFYAAILMPPYCRQSLSAMIFSPLSPLFSHDADDAAAID
jgi:hypothetical protein